MISRIALTVLMMLLPRAIPFVGRFLRLLWKLSFDRRVPFILRLLVPLALLYSLWPYDLLKDSLPIFGRLDDLIFLALAVFLLIKLAPPEVVAEHWGKRQPPTPPQEKDPSKVVDGVGRTVE